MVAQVNQNDPRVKRTRELLQRTFTELIHEKSFEAITVQDIADAYLQAWQFGVKALADNGALVRQADVVILAVKPQIMAPVRRETMPAPTSRPSLRRRSIAGVTFGSRRYGTMPSAGSASAMDAWYATHPSDDW